MLKHHRTICYAVVPHITDAIQQWVVEVAKHPVTADKAEPEVCIIELGGTTGDIEGMPFIEAFRQFQFRVKRENFCCLHVSLVPKVRYMYIKFVIFNNF